MIKGSGAQKNLMNDLIWRKNTSIIPINTFCSFFAGFPHADTLFRTIRIGVSLLNHPGWHQKQHENQGLILQPSHLHDVLEEGAEDDDKEDFPRPLSLIISGPGFEPNTWVSKNPNPGFCFDWLSLGWVYFYVLEAEDVVPRPLLSLIMLMRKSSEGNGAAGGRWWWCWPYCSGRSASGFLKSKINGFFINKAQGRVH